VLEEDDALTDFLILILADQNRRFAYGSLFVFFLFRRIYWSVFYNHSNFVVEMIVKLPFFC